jgi:hypothetical protein
MCRGLDPGHFRGLGPPSQLPFSLKGKEFTYVGLHQ